MRLPPALIRLAERNSHRIDPSAVLRDCQEICQESTTFQAADVVCWARRFDMTHMTSLRYARASSQRTLLAAALGLAALTAGCAAPVQAPVQQANQPAAGSFVEQLRDLVPRQNARNASAPSESPQAPQLAPLPVVHWPALGAGDFEQVRMAPLPTVNWPALGAGDFAPVAPALPTVHWPALGAGDFGPIAASLPMVNWPALGAGDFVQVAAPLPVVHWPALGAADFEDIK